MRPSYRPFVALAVLVLLAAPPGLAQAVISQSHITISLENAGTVTVASGSGCNVFITPFTADGYKSTTSIDPPATLGEHTSEVFSIRGLKAGITRIGFRVIGEDVISGGSNCTDVEEVFIDITVLDGKTVEGLYKKASKQPLSSIKAVTSAKTKEIDVALKQIVSQIDGNPLANGLTATIDGTNVVIQALDDIDKATRTALKDIQATGNAILADQGFVQALMPAGLQHGGGGQHDALLMAIDKLYASMWTKIAKSWQRFEVEVETISRDTDNPVQVNSVLRRLHVPVVNGPWAPDSSPPDAPPEAFQLPLVVAVSQREGSGRMLLRGLAEQDLDDIYEVRMSGPEGAYTALGVSFISGTGLWTLGIPGLEYPGNYNVNIARNLDPVLMPVDVINVAYPASP